MAIASYIYNGQNLLLTVDNEIELTFDSED